MGSIDKEIKDKALQKRENFISLLISSTIIFFLFLAYASFNYWAVKGLVNSVSSHSVDIINNGNIKIYINKSVFIPIIKFYIDGIDITDRLSLEDKKYCLKFKGLSEGEHELKIVSNGQFKNLLFLIFSKSINFKVDKTPPLLKFISPFKSIVKQREVIFQGQTEPFVMINFLLGKQKYITESDKEGFFCKKIFLNKEINIIKINLVDKAGNNYFLTKKIIVDVKKPEIKIISPLVGQIVKTKTKIISAKINDIGSGIKHCYLEIDGKKVKANYDKKRKILYKRVNYLDEGLYDVRAFATDRAGLVNEKKWSFIVDSTESVGKGNIRPGAQGEDVKKIQRRLVRLGLLKKSQISGVFDTTTTRSIIKVQKIRKIKPSGIIDKKTYMAITNKVYVYLREFALVLVSPNNRIVKKFPIACGSPWHPTPTGKFFITEKVYYPAWYPPKSPWARGAKVIPPGPGNPLGTRWIGLNANIVGIHGTSSPWSIGRAASHGCIRMYIRDIEELYELIDIGTPVTIYNKKPKSHIEMRKRKINNRTISAGI